MKKFVFLFIALIFTGCMHIPTMQRASDNRLIYVVEDTKAGDYTFVEKNTPLSHWIIGDVDAYCNEKNASLAGYGCFTMEGDLLTKGMEHRTFEWKPLTTPIKITKERPKKTESGVPFVGTPHAVAVGDAFFTFTAIDPLQRTENFKYDLTTTAINDKEIALQYAEYYMNDSGAWLIKQGFNKTFTYALSDKVIRFTGYEFEILGVDKGQLTYKRVK